MSLSILKRAFRIYSKQILGRKTCKRSFSTVNYRKRRSLYKYLSTYTQRRYFQFRKNRIENKTQNLIIFLDKNNEHLLKLKSKEVGVLDGDCIRVEVHRNN